MSRKTNRDHAKRQQRPMIEDEAIAGQLEDLLSEAIASQRKYCRQLGLRDFHTNSSFDGGRCINYVMARCCRSQRINKNAC